MKILKLLASVATLTVILWACSTDNNTTQSSDKKINPSTVKPSAPISMNYEILTALPKAGQEIEIKLTFDSKFDAVVTTHMTSAKKLSWLSSQKSWKSNLAGSDQQNMLPNIKVVAPKDGLYYIHFVASIVQDGKVLPKAFTIPLQVGEGPFKPEPVGEVITDDKGKKVIIQKGESDN